MAIDLAKSVYHVHAVDARGELVERKKLSRSKLQGWLSNLLPCEVAMEACEGAHYWARVVVRGAHAEDYRAAVRAGVCEVEQERLDGCGSDSRSGEPSGDARRGDER